MALKKTNVIILVGMMGSGKSTVGQLLSKKLGFEFIDTDQMIVDNEQLSINEIFDNNGEAYFRDLEKNILDEVDFSNVVIATGGGLPVFKNNMDILIDRGTTIYLKISAAEVYFRVKEFNNRPLFENSIPKVQQILNDRKGFYSKAKISIDCTGKRPSEIVDEIRTSLKI